MIRFSACVLRASLFSVIVIPPVFALLPTGTLNVHVDTWILAIHLNDHIVPPMRVPQVSCLSLGRWREKVCRKTETVYLQLLFTEVSSTTSNP